MNIGKSHLEYKRRVGDIKGLPVFELATTGGLHMLIVARGGVFETIGTGPHRAVARHIAKKREPDLNITELSKSDHIDPENFQDLLPKYEAFTNEMRSAQGL